MKKIIALTLTFSILFGLTGTTRLFAAAAADSTEVITVYDLSNGCFLSFLDNTDYDTLNSAINDESTNVITVRYKGEPLSVGLSDLSITQSIDESKLGKYAYFFPGRLGLPNDKTILDVLSLDAIKKCLADNHIQCNVSDYKIFVNPYYYQVFIVPLSVWVRTDKGDYIITLMQNILHKGNYYYPDESGYYPDLSGSYGYAVYTSEEYHDKFQMHEGRLLVDGKDITGDNYVYTRNFGAYLPLRALMEGIGYTVTWNDDTQTITMIGAKGQCNVTLSNGVLIPVIKGEDPPYMWSQIDLTYEMVDGRVIVTDSVAEFFAKFFTGYYSGYVDPDNHTISYNEVMSDSLWVIKGRRVPPTAAGD